MHRRTAALAATVVAGLATTVVAHAHWSGAGGGAGWAATTGSTHPVHVGPATPAATLHPGGQADVALRMTNPNPFPVRVPDLTLDAASGTGGFTVAEEGCDVEAFTFQPRSNDGRGWTVPASSGATAGSVEVTLPTALGMGAGAANACQGATVTVHLQAGR